MNLFIVLCNCYIHLVYSRLFREITTVGNPSDGSLLAARNIAMNKKNYGCMHCFDFVMAHISHENGFIAFAAHIHTRHVAACICFYYDHRIPLNTVECDAYCTIIISGIAA